jgi:hypothetical protein
MGDIKRQISSIIDLKRGSVNVNYVYRANTLVWQRGTPPVTETLWLLRRLGTVLSEPKAGELAYMTEGLNTKFK